MDSTTPSQETTTQASTQTTQATTTFNWEAVKTALYTSLVVAGIILLVWGGVTMAAEYTQKQIQKEFLQANDDAARAAFAKRYVNHPLGGLILLAQAQTYYAQGDYTAAKAAYAQVQTGGLKSNTILAQQAQLGEAFSQFALNAAEGAKALQTIAMNTNLLDSTRANAAYELTGYYMQQKDLTSAKKYLKLIDTLNQAKPWQRQASFIKELYPQVNN